MPGYDVRVLDEGGHEVKRGNLGAICIKTALAARLPADLVEQ